MGVLDQQTRFGLRDVPIYVIASAIGLHPSYCVRVRTDQSLPIGGTGRPRRPRSSVTVRSRPL
jgi:hypothetical protein